MKKHRHTWKRAGQFRHVAASNPLSAGPVIAEVYTCLCGAHYECLTEAGVQQWESGDLKTWKDVETAIYQEAAL